MNSETPEQKEAAWNVKTEKWMQQNARRFRMAWMVIPANVCITSKYILRYYLTMVIGITIVYTLVFPLGLLVVFALTAYFASGFRAYLLRIDSHLVQAVYILLLHTYGHQLPFFLSFAVVFPLLLSAYLAKCAKYWNRRALRLQTNPESSSVALPNPSIWPPPPRIAD